MAKVGSVIKKLVADWLVYAGARCFIAVVQALRMETCQAVAKALAVVACDLLAVRRRVVDENLSHVFPEMTPRQRRALTRRMWEHLLLMVCEVAHAPRKIHRTNWWRYVHIHRTREFIRYLLDPRPIVVVSGHLGNFEMGGYVTGLLGFPSFAVARSLDNPFLDRYINRFRGANGQFIIPKDGSAGQIQRVLDAGHTLSLLGDQHAGNKGCWVDFMGRPASCHKAIALFSLTTGAPLLVAYALRSGKPLHFQTGLAAVWDPREPSEEMSSVLAVTNWYNRALETLIRKTPDQYWWLHRRWKQPTRRLLKGAARRSAA